jgi:hypothetical protein
MRTPRGTPTPDEARRILGVWVAALTNEEAVALVLLLRSLFGLQALGRLAQADE